MTEPWQEPFHISDEEIVLWRQKIGPGESLLLWAIQNQKVDENQYLEWARDFYKIPLVQSNYFSSPLSQAAIKRDLPNFCDETHVPIGQWDGQIFIGCLEPLPASDPLISFVLAPHKPLLERWKMFFSPPAGPTDSDHVSSLFDPKTIEMDLDSIEVELEITQPDIDHKPPETDPPIDSVAQEFASNEASFGDVTHPSFDTSASLTPISIKNLSTKQQLSSQLADIFTITSRYFEKSMILKYNNKRFLPWKWHGPWLAMADAEDHPIHLSAPSLFRICFQTKLPYHGPIVSNAVHNEFFSLWDKSRIPNHVTLYPVISEKNLLGAIMGLSSVNLVNNENSLKLLQDLHPTLIELFRIGTKDHSAA